MKILHTKGRVKRVYFEKCQSKTFLHQKRKNAKPNPQTSFWLKCTCQMRLVFVSHFCTTYFSEFTICQKEKREVKPRSNESTYMLGSHKQTHEERKGLERSSIYCAFIPASVPAQIGCKIEHTDKIQTQPPPFSFPTHISPSRPGELQASPWRKVI